MKFSEIMTPQKPIEEAATVDRISSAQSLVLFDDVLDGEKVMRSPEIEKIVRLFYGRPALSIAQVENPDKLRDWFQDEQYKADVQNRAMTYPFKAAFEDLTLDTHSDQYSGPLFVQMFSTGDTEFDVLTITCCWGDGLFRNDYYVVCAIVDTGDLDMIIDALKME